MNTHTSTFLTWFETTEGGWVAISPLLSGDHCDYAINRTGGHHLGFTLSMPKPHGDRIVKSTSPPMPSEAAAMEAADLDFIETLHKLARVTNDSGETHKRARRLLKRIGDKAREAIHEEVNRTAGGKPQHDFIATLQGDATDGIANGTSG